MLAPVVLSFCRHPVACRRAAPPLVLVVRHDWRALRAREVQACSCLLSLRGLATMAPHMARRELDGAFALSASGQTPTHIADKLRAARHARGAAGPDLTTVRRALRGQTHKRSPKDWGPCLRWAPRLAACDPAPGASEDPIELTPQKAFGLFGLGARWARRRGIGRWRGPLQGARSSEVARRGRVSRCMERPRVAGDARPAAPYFCKADPAFGRGKEGINPRGQGRGGGAHYGHHAQSPHRPRQ